MDELDKQRLKNELENNEKARKQTYLIADWLMFAGLGIIIFCVFVLGDEDGDGQIDNKILMVIGGLLSLCGGLIKIYSRFRDPE